jgi:hypothetical protein
MTITADDKRKSLEMGFEACYCRELFVQSWKTLGNRFVRENEQSDSKRTESILEICLT